MIRLLGARIHCFKTITVVIALFFVMADGAWSMSNVFGVQGHRERCIH